MALAYITPDEDFYYPDDGLKQCRRCYKRLPKTDFNKQSSRPDGLFTYCRQCFKEYRRELAERKRRGDFDHMVHKASLCKKDRIVVEWARKIIRRFGGLEKSVEFVHRAITEAADLPIPRRSVLEFFQLIFRILKYEEEQLAEIQRRQPAPEKMTDSELEAELRRTTRGL
jgi:hypothetical protein